MTIVGEAVHYVRNSSGSPEYPNLCRAALITEPGLEGFISLVAFDPSGMRFYSGCQRDDNPFPRGGTWHYLQDCPV